MNRKQRRAAGKPGTRTTHQPGTGAPGTLPGIDMAFTDGLAHHQAGRLAEAERLYWRVLAIEPGHADSLHLLGLIAYQGRRYDLAIERIQRAIAINGREAVYHFNLAIAFQDRGSLDEAIASYRRAIALDPCHWRALNNLADMLRDKGDLAEAVTCYRRAIDLIPGDAEAHNNLGGVLHRQGLLEDAVACYRAAIEARPDHALARNNLGLALQDQGRWSEAMAAFEAAASIAPDAPIVRWNRALALLLRGNFEAGWRDYHWCQGTSLFTQRNFSQPPWRGEDIAGRTILIHAGQGAGDTIQFVRYARHLKGRGASVVVECLPELARLLKTARGVDRVIAKGETPPAFDCHAALHALPFLLGTRVDTIPAHTPYVQADGDLDSAWRGRLDRAGPNIGLVWRGSPNHRHDGTRSIAPGFRAEICGAPGMHWFSLQKDARPDELGALSGSAGIVDCGPWLGDWADTAALVSCLDLVVTVDTGIAHLAGALGRPAWVLLPFNPDWRWLLGRPDSPWYPTLRLFRQPAPGDWRSVLLEVRRELERGWGD
jgi:Flp pilus assembly protein TadD